MNRNFSNSNEIFPIIDLIRRELKVAGMLGGGDDLTMQGRGMVTEPRIVDSQAVKALPDYPSIVTGMIYTYENGMIEKLTLDRNDSFIVTGFLIEIEGATIINEALEEETDMSQFQSIYCTIRTDENGLFDGLHFDYSEGA